MSFSAKMQLELVFLVSPPNNLKMISGDKNNVTDDNIRYRTLRNHENKDIFNHICFIYIKRLLWTIPFNKKKSTQKYVQVY